MSDASHPIDEGAGPAVLCLHGFPENASAFDDVAASLVRQGFRVIRYDQRGYTDDRSDRSRLEFTATKLALDAIAVLDTQGVDSCIVLGHDLGGIVAWEVGRLAPARVRGIVVVSVPHPAAFLLSLLGIRQMVRGWYFLIAQATWLTLAVYSPRRETSRARLLARLTRTGLAPAEAERYVEHLAVDRRFVGAVRWYQAMPFTSLAAVWFRAKTNVHLIWGAEDRLTVGLGIRLSRIFVPRDRLRVSVVDGGSHWIVDHEPDTVVRAVSEASRDWM